MGSQYHITVVNPPKHLAQQQLADEIASRLASLHAALSSFDDSSQISYFNSRPVDEWVGVSSDLMAVLKESQRTSEITHGAFDITVGPLIELWGFGRRETDDQIPDEQEIRQALARVDYRAIMLDEQKSNAKRLRDVTVNVSSVGDGYGADAIDALLMSKGCRDYLVDVGGEMVARGLSPRADAWRVAIDAPDEMPGTVYKALRLSDGWAVSTSGDYRNYFEKAGKRYSHMLNPSTGRPIEHSLASVTVIDRQAIRADSLSTALMVLGPEKGLALADSMGVAAYFIVRNKEGFASFQTSTFEKFAEH